MKYIIALSGNPNCGKTTLFNQITGSKGHVGNWPGVTVEKKSGEWKADHNFEIQDLPGTYSLSAYSEEEKIAADYINGEKASCVIDIIDSTNFERNMYLAYQIMKADVPLVLALNMSDELKAKGDVIDSIILSEELGVPCVPIIARTGEGVDKLMKVVKETAIKGTKPKRLPLYDELDSMNPAQKADFIYNNIGVLSKKVLTKSKKEKEDKTTKADKILTSRILGLPIFALVMYVVFQLTLSENLFGLGINGLGYWLAGYVEIIWGWLTNLLSVGIMALGASGSSVIYGLLINGVMGGIGAIFGFLPLVLVLFLLMSILEDSGYMARIAFILDRIFRKFGLSGKAFIPLMMGFGCAVPAIMATRTLEEEKDRKITTIITAFMPCGAKLPIIALFSTILFSPSESANITFLVYFLAMLTAVIVSLLLNKIWYKGKTSAFVMELPQYRMPTIRSVWNHAYEKIKHFIIKAGTIILYSTILIWFLVSFNVNSFNGNNLETNGGESVMSEMDNSFMASIGRFVSPVFRPLGIQGWRPTVGIVTGWIAKENVIVTFSQVYGDDVTQKYVDDYFKDRSAEELESLGFENGKYDRDIAMDIYNDSILPEGKDPNALPTVRKDIPTKSAGLAYIMFNLLCMPCFAAVGAMHNELKTWRETSKGVGVQMLAAYVVAFIIRIIGLIVGF